MAVLGWALFTPEGVQSKQFAKTNIINLLIWGLWWPAMVWVVVPFGRIWCAVCPLELLANITERLGRLSGFKQRKLRRWLRSGVLMPIVMVSMLSLLLLAVMSYFGVRESRLADPETHKSRVPLIILTSVASAFLILGWGSVR